MALTPESKSIVEGMIVRTMRHQGFIGDITVTNVRSRKGSRAGSTVYSADVKASMCGGKTTAPYRATIGGGRHGGISIKRVAEPVQHTS